MLRGHGDHCPRTGATNCGSPALRSLSLRWSHPSLDVDECQQAGACAAGATCINSAGGHSCVCPASTASADPAVTPCSRELCLGLSDLP